VTLVAFASAKGSPGVSSAVRRMAELWGGDPIVADLDPAGGDTVLVERDEAGELLDADTGLVSLGAALRGGKPTDLLGHVQRTDGGLQVLAGVSTPVQVHAIGPVWSHVADALKGSRDDVLADVGRFEVGSAVQPVLEAADAVVFIARDDLPSLAHLRDRLHGLREALSIGRLGGTPVGVALVGDPRSSRSMPDTVRLLASSGIDVVGLGVIADDPRTVAGWHRASERARSRSVYLRSLVDVTARIRELVTTAAVETAVPGEAV